MKKTLWVCFFLLYLPYCLISYAKPNEQVLDQIVAVVNDDVITKMELDHALSLAKMQIGEEHSLSESILKKQVLDQLINKKLQLDIAKQAGIAIKDIELNDAIDNVARQNGMSIETLYKRLTQEGMSVAEYRNELRDQMTINKVQQQEVISRLRVSPQEITSFMRSKMWENNNSKEYHVQNILIPLSDTPSTEEVLTAKKRALEVINRVNKGEDFRTVARSESGDQHALEGGDLGWRKLAEIPSAFAEQVSHMQAKEVAGPIQTSNGFHIIRIAAVRDTEAKKSTLDNKQVEQLLLQRKFEEALQNWVSRLRGQAYIVVTV